MLDFAADTFKIILSEISSYFYDLLFDNTMPLVIIIARLFILTFSIVYIFKLISFVVFSERVRRTRKSLNRIHDRFEDKFTELLARPDNLQINEVQSYLGIKPDEFNPGQLHTITNLLLSVREDIINYNFHNFQLIEDAFGLRPFWESQLSVENPRVQSRAIQKLSAMGISGISEAPLNTLAYSRDKSLRRLARSSYVFLTDNTPFRFFNEDFDHGLTSWDKIFLHDMLVKRPYERLPSFIQWYRNSNDKEMRIFLVNEIKFFNQDYALPYLWEEFNKTEDEDVRKAILDTLGDLRYAEVEEELIQEYPTMSESVQSHVVDALLHFRSGRAMPFFQNAYSMAISIDAKLHIADAIKNYGPEGDTILANLKNSEDELDRKILQHFELNY